MFVERVGRPIENGDEWRAFRMTGLWDEESITTNGSLSVCLVISFFLKTMSPGRSTGGNWPFPFGALDLDKYG